jgi:large subunit ribosomal protein LP2
LRLLQLPTVKMKHLAAYLLLGLGGNTSPSAADVKEVLESVGIEADSERLDKLISELEGKDINEVMSTRTEPMWTCLLIRCF